MKIAIKMEVSTKVNLLRLFIYNKLTTKWGINMSTESSTTPIAEKINPEDNLPWKKSPKLDIKLVMFISLGFFTSSAAWSIYNTNVNIALNNLLSNLALVGFLMTMDNIIGVIIQPIIGNLSDRTKSRFGRRIPYLMIGIPIAAIFFVLIPVVDQNIVLLLLVMFVFNIAMALYRAPAVSLMPDFVAPKDRSKANGVVNMIGAVGGVFAYSLGLIIDQNIFVVFLIVALIMVSALLVLLWKVKEPDTRNWDFEGIHHENKINLIESIRIVAKEPDKSTIFMLLAIFSWFVTYQALEAFWSIYAVEYMGVTRGTATFALNFVALPVIIFGIPAGILAKKIGRRKTILLGLTIGCPTIFLGYFIESMTLMYVVFVIFGICWSGIVVNSIAIIWELAPTAKEIGTYTGLYYFASFMAAIVGPTIVGVITEYITGLRALFLITGGFLFLAIFFMLLVRRGEPALSEDEKLAKQQAIIDKA
jgi:MFS family permease